MRPARPRSGAGFTLVELLLVLVIMGLLASLGMPQAQRAIVKARAAEAVGDLHVVRVALHTYLSDHHVWPADVNRGQIPSGLSPYLPEGFTFDRPFYVIDYEEYSSKPQGFVGLSIITDDRDMGQAMLDLLQPNAWTNGVRRFTWVIEWSD